MIQEYLELANQQYSTTENAIICGAAIVAAGAAAVAGAPLLAPTLGAEAAAGAAGAIGYFTGREVAKLCVEDERKKQNSNRTNR